MLSNYVKALCLIFLVCLSLCDCTDKDQAHLTELSNKEVVIEYPGFSEGMLMVTNGKSGAERRCGFLDTEGNLAVPFKYPGCQPYTEGLARALKSKTDSEQIFCYIDKTGAEIISEVDGKTIYMCDAFRDGYATVYPPGREGGYVIDAQGNVCLTPTENKYYYRNLGGGLFGRYFSAVSMENGQGVVDINGVVKYSGSYSLVEPANPFNGFYVADSWESYGIMDNLTFEPVTEPIYNRVTPFVDGAAAVTTSDGAVQLIDPQGKCLVDYSAKYQNIDSYWPPRFNNGVAALNFTNGKGAIIIDIDGQVVAETDYDTIDFCQDGIGVCEKNGKYGYVDIKGKELLSPIYDFTTGTYQGVGFVTKAGKNYRFVR